MRKVMLLIGIPALALALGGAAPERNGPDDAPTDARAELRRAQAAGREAAARSVRFEREAEAARDAATRTRVEAAALAARIQQAESAIASAEARLALAAREQARLREEIGRQQRPVAHLAAALQQFSRRPVALAVLQPGSVKDAVHLRALLDGAVPQIRARTAGLRTRLARSRAVRAEAVAARAALTAEQQRLAQRRTALAALETRQRLASRRASGTADRETERALALAEEARDLDALVGELDRAGDLGARLAALPGPLLRPAQPDAAQLTVAPPAPQPSGNAPPAPYLLPVAGRILVGFGAPQGERPSSGLTLAPRPGAQVVAPGAGRVAFAGPYRGYGRIVIITHAGGWTSLVTGLARTDVTVGESVVAGAPIGIAAQARPEVTLELRRAGQAVNPVRFVG
jgi:septal ring factor EnvC (AmiA/AmiB activator)